MPKKRSHGEGGLYYIASKGLYRGVVDVGLWPDGRRRQKSVTAKTKTAARAKLDALKAEIAQYGAPLDNAVTVETWANHWLDTVCRPTMKPSALKAYRSNLNKWIIPIIGRKRLAQLRPSDLRAVYKAIDDAGLKSTASKAHTVMSSMLESARLDGAIGRNIARDIVAPSEGLSERGALDTPTALALLSTAARHPDGTRWWVALLAGMRQGERIGATLDSIDLERHTFTVQWSLTEAVFEHGCDGTCGYKKGGNCPNRQLDLARNLEHRPIDGRLILVRPKSGKPRTFPLIPQLEAALVRYLEATKDVPNPHGLIWRNPDGSPITGKEDGAAWRALLHEAGVESVATTHWARHTTATVLMELGVDARVVGEVVGHTSTRTTNRYQHVSSAAAQAAMEALGGHFSKALEA